MKVTVLVRAEVIPESQKLVWWAESPDVSGFSATAETLVHLRELTTEALGEIWRDRGEDPDAIEMHYEMRPPEPASLGVHIARQPDQRETEGPPVVEQTAAVAVA